MPWTTLLDAARDIEALGADVLFNWDHFFGPGTASSEPHFECWTVLAGWAAGTRSIELGPLVSAVGYRNPDLLADMARTVDHISEGRFILGVGAGFKARDYEEYGYPFVPPAARIAELDEGLSRIRRRLGHLNPAPLRPLPVLIGGSGEHRMLRVVAQHADIWHTFAEGVDFERKSALLDTYCRDVGRDPAAIERSVLVAGDPAAVGEPLLALGATLFVVHLPKRPDPQLGSLGAWLTWRDRQNACGGRPPTPNGKI